METKQFQQYKGQAINTMTQGELLLLLYDELVKRLTRAELALDKGDFALMEASVDRSAEILRYLDDTLDMQYEISANLTRLYEFFLYELNRVKAGRNKTELVRVKTMVTELRDSFRIAEKNSSAANPSGHAVPASQVTGQPVQPEAPVGYAPPAGRAAAPANPYGYAPPGVNGK